MWDSWLGGNVQRGLGKVRAPLVWRSKGDLPRIPVEGSLGCHPEQFLGRVFTSSELGTEVRDWPSKHLGVEV